mmetsp:Transcript_7750/g.5813  ORF Transcript_7750/g.5813 Transcript_7750/m.5813 type:complete len:148 (+) Transcript_7750:72-515(+)|eukprot:CAMPEP_0202971532 /NCGR_PEP_ID=MMETSP1396-20130829/28347_1 /ASSEMBLY_ACC=CAM_ASM_000872 /TAXON_ID= /ORGANISM="Pseudokeronopsis sp., Strain Brazil" /LENGTH=147 /DNA_ID=CAMNT_0049701009 /DNA_START=61 /DNA_END=504 /DNA_ORIENTATION=+
MFRVTVRSAKSLISVSKQRSYLSTIKYSESHEYIKVDGKTGIVGITKHAADALGDVVFVDLPAVGAKFSAGASFGSVESVKAASDVYAPVSGEVIAVNSELEGNPAKVNESPLGEGWFIKLKIDNEADLNKLLDEAGYKKHLDESSH